MNWGGLTQHRARPTRSRKQKKHCILLWMNGGASQFETFDMKPGRPTGGPFRPIATNVPGTQVCELMPKMAQQMDKVAVIRSMQTSRGRSSRRHLPDAHRLPPGGQRPLPRDRRDRRQVPGPRGGRPAELRQDRRPTATPAAGFLGPKYQPFGIGRDGDLPHVLRRRTWTRRRS